MDQLLLETGLFGRGVIPIDTPEGVARYNEALDELGIAPTTKEKFNVDGIGFSLEIAAEKGNRDYLAHGPANQCGIIVSPDQEGKPILFPAHSSYRRVVRELFEKSRGDIADTTASANLRLTFLHNLGEFDYDSPKDYLYLDRITVQASAGSITNAARDQRELASTAKTRADWWADADLRRRLMESGKVWGDLRRRHLEIPDHSIILHGTFWTRAFGGLFVLTSGTKKILVVEDETQLEGLTPQKGERYHVFSLRQRRELIEHLRDEHLVDLDLKYYQGHPEDLNDIKNFIVADFVCRADPDCDLHSMSLSKRKGIVNDRKATTSSLLPQIERFQRNVSGRLGGKQQDHLPDDLELMLLHPTDRAGDSARPILRMLLLRMQENPVDVMRLYAYDKERFFALFETWPASKKRWAAKFIMARYRAEMNQPKLKETKQ